VRKSGREFTPHGPQIEYCDGEFQCIRGSISSRPEKLLEFDFILNTLKEWPAGPLAVTTFTGEPANTEADILAACKYLEISRDDIKLWLALAEPELKEDFRNPVVVQEIVDAAREYANTIFRNDFCVDWGIKRYRLGIAEPQKVGTDRAVRRWNDAVRQTVDVAGSV
jgi:hypothetical protein